MTPEGKIKHRLKKRLKLEFPDHYLFMPVQTGFGAPSLDFLICIGGLFIAIETKAPGKKPTLLQDRTSQNIREAGGLVFVIDGDKSIDAAFTTIRRQLIARFKSEPGLDYPEERWTDYGPISERDPTGW